MADNNQAYRKVCGECGTTALKLFLTQVQTRNQTKVYRMICEACTANHKHNYE